MFATYRPYGLSLLRLHIVVVWCQALSTHRQLSYNSDSSRFMIIHLQKFVEVKPVQKPHHLW